MAAAATAPEPNLVLAGRYRLEKRLGAGGMGAIWQAEHLVLRAPVAVKLLEREALPDDDTISRFMREAQAAATLRSPHVVQILDYGIDGRWPFIVMELLEGENLAQRIKRNKRLSPEATMRILTHVARAMVRAHEAGVVHRDLKPENVFLIRNEDEEIAKVLDFGVAKVSSTALAQGEGSAKTRTGSILGTPYYMSPEQAQGNKAVDHRTDLWALAVITFECLTGTRPFFSDGLGDLVLSICVRDIPVPSERAPVPLGFDAWFAKGVARDPDLRFQSPREMMETLREALGLEALRPGSDPDVLVSSSTDERDTQEGDSASERPPNSAVATVIQSTPGKKDAPPSSQVVSARGSQGNADVHAATMAAPPSERDSGAPALTEAQFGTTSQGAARAAERKTALGGVIFVALGALAVGLVAGLVALPRYSQFGRSEALAPLPAPLPPTRDAREARPKKAAKASDPEAAASTSAKPESSADAVPSASAGALSSAEVKATKPDGRRDDQEAELGEESRSVPPTAPTPWVKPDWAQPDDEIIRRPPIQDP